MDEDRVVDGVLIGILLTVVILKITNVITISWLALVSPILFLLGIGVLMALVFAIYVIIELFFIRKRR